MRLQLGIICLGLAPLLIAASQPVRLQPSSPWDVDYAENSCRLVRKFGQGKTDTILAFESSVPGQMDMLVFGKPLDTFSDPVPARFLPASQNTIDGHLAQTTTNHEPAILWPNVSMLPDDTAASRKAEQQEHAKHPGVRPPPVSVADQETLKLQRAKFATDVTELEIDVRRNRPLILETGSLGPAMKAFDQCSRDSLTDWGVDPNVEDKIVRPVWAMNPTEWLSYADYPRDMAAKGAESQVEVRLLIDASGKVTKCTSLSHYDEPEFNRITCDLIARRGRFEPAELADGTKVPSYYAQRVIFRMAH